MHLHEMLVRSKVARGFPFRIGPGGEETEAQSDEAPLLSIHNLTQHEQITSDGFALHLFYLQLHMLLKGHA